MTDQLKPILSVQTSRRPLYIAPYSGHLVKDWVNLGGPKTTGNPHETDLKLITNKCKYLEDGCRTTSVFKLNNPSFKLNHACI